MFLFFYLQKVKFKQFLLNFFNGNITHFDFSPGAENFRMEMKFGRLFIIQKRKYHKSKISPSEYSINKYSQHIQKRTVFHRKENRNKNAVVANLERVKRNF